MVYRIDADKLERVVVVFNEQVDPRATSDLVESEICSESWEPGEGQGHQEWIDSADVEEIVDWLASFYS